jgi:transcriptional antiterminator
LSSIYKVVKPFNHNVVFCIDAADNRECILIGKGIGFGVNDHSSIDSDKIEKAFYLINKENKNKFQSMADSIDANIIGVVEEAIAMFHNEFGQKLDEKIHITFLDHVAFAIQRHKNGIDIKNPFMVEIKTLYNNEYNIALKALNAINSKLGLDLPQDEVGFITMHLHAAINNGSISKTSINTMIINELVQFVEERLGVEIDKDSIDYSRLVTHLRFALDRASKKIPIKNLLLGSIKRKFKDSYKIASEIRVKLKDEYKIILTDDEIGYLALYLEKLKNKY